jgi:zeaxanthin glucosyltransferase
MHHFGLICPPAASHVTGLGAIGRVLLEHGHRVTLFSIVDTRKLAEREQIAFHPIGQKAHPAGSFQKFSERIAQLKGLAALRFGLQVAKSEIHMLLDEAPGALAGSQVSALLVDQGQPAGSTLAECLDIPFFTICNAPPVNYHPSVPPASTGWLPGSNYLVQLRNRIMHTALDLGLGPLRRQINQYRQENGLKPLASLQSTGSPWAQISQQTRDFDFPNPSLPEHFHYVGLFHRLASSSVPFPFEQLGSQPLVYATFGTILKGSREAFYTLAKVCATLDAQLVISLGGRGRVSDYPGLPGRSMVVEYAPQLELLKRCSLTVCHAGNNTVLESLSYGVPVLAIPVWGDQPGVAARLVRSGAGERISPERLAYEPLLKLCRRLLEQASYRERARNIAASIENAGGEVRAAQIIESVLDRIQAR